MANMLYNVRMETYTLYLAKRQLAELAKLKASLGLSISEIIRRAIDEYLAKPEISQYLNTEDGTDECP